jgi:hypothetical protein
MAHTITSKQCFYPPASRPGRYSIALAAVEGFEQLIYSDSPDSGKMLDNITAVFV